MNTLRSHRWAGSWFARKMALALALAAGMAGTMKADDNNPAAATPAPSPTNAVSPDNAIQPLSVRQSYTRGIGVGAIFGEPTGLNVKGWISDQSAIDGAVAYSFRRPHSLDVYGDYLWHNFDLLPVSRGKLPVYFGVGGRLRVEEHRDTRFGVRIPVGISYMFDSVPLDLFAEIAPVLDVTPSVRGAIEGGIGVRYWFR